MLLNLFLAILLKFISDSDEGDTNQEENTKIETPRSAAPGKMGGGINDSKRIDN